jgi:transposase, IS30 family
MTKYRRVTAADRIIIYTLLSEGYGNNGIASKTGFNKGTISREVRRNKGEKGYRHKQAEAKSQARLERFSEPRKMNEEFIKKISALLANEQWSPEQISHRLKKEGHASISHETIYKFVYEDKKNGGELYKNLRQGRKQRKRRFPSQKRTSRLKNINQISDRPKCANERLENGHFERDLVIGKKQKQAVLTIVDRKSRYTKLKKLDGKDSVTVGEKTVEALVGIKKITITNDRGLEFADHKTTESKLDCKIYFCDPYSSQQRGTNENTNGLLRQYLPKGSDFANVTENEIQIFENKLNSRPRKCLDWSTPYEKQWGVSVALTN